MKIKEVYGRIGVSKARMPVLEHLPNDSDILDLIEIWDGGPMEGHIFIQKDNGKYVIYEMIHHFNAKSETIYKHTIQDDLCIRSIMKEIEDLCENRYEGTLRFDFEKMMEDKTVRAFFGL